MRAAGLIVVSVGLIIWFPLVVLWLGLLIAPRGASNDERIAESGPSAADLNQAAESRLVEKAFRPVSAIFVACLLVGGVLVLVGS